MTWGFEEKAENQSNYDQLSICLVFEKVFSKNNTKSVCDEHHSQ